MWDAPSMLTGFRFETRTIVLVAVGILLSGGLVILNDERPLMADTHWPTPPPGPQASPAKVILEKDIKRVRVPAVPGAISWIVQPLAMSIPRFPPVPSSSFRSPEGVLIVSDAGWIDTTVQLVYEPVDLDDSRVRPPGSGQKLRQVFDLRAFDHRANRIDLKLLRPWILEVPVQGLTNAFEEPDILLLSRYDKDEGWVPLVTTYFLKRGVLQARVLTTGLFGIIAEPPILSGATPTGNIAPSTFLG